ncbi:MAG: Tim44 domain-containing protein [Deltaproteobacteria bacterium]|nr:Tim44 domain-containing protein [Deltaproteobacteria bacterium]
MIVKKFLSLFVCAFLLMFVLEGISEARRFGGGRSFGSRPSYQRSYKKTPAPQRDAARPQQGPVQNPASRGLFGGMGGMLGGFLMGGLLGSLLFGGAGGFHGPGLLDILIIGGGLFLLFRFLRARRDAMQAAGPMSFQGAGADPSMEPGVGTSRPGWGALGYGQDLTQGAAPIPPGFDVEEFLTGAKAAYNRIQQSWDKRDLEDIRHFTSPEVWEEMHRQAQEDPTPGKTEIVLLKADVLEVKREGSDTVASVIFDVLMRESADEKRPKQVKEMWHFSRKEDVPGSFWVLEGIQQLED